jgi:hypothetical protein
MGVLCLAHGFLLSQFPDQGPINGAFFFEFRVGRRGGRFIEPGEALEIVGEHLGEGGEGFGEFLHAVEADFEPSGFERYLRRQGSEGRRFEIAGYELAQGTPGGLGPALLLEGDSGRGVLGLATASRKSMSASRSTKRALPTVRAGKSSKQFLGGAGLELKEVLEIPATPVRAYGVLDGAANQVQPGQPGEGARHGKGSPVTACARDRPGVRRSRARHGYCVPPKSDHSGSR